MVAFNITKAAVACKNGAKENYELYRSTGESCCVSC